MFGIETDQGVHLGALDAAKPLTLGDIGTALARAKPNGGVDQEECQLRAWRLACREIAQTIDEEYCPLVGDDFLRELGLPA